MICFAIEIKPLICLALKVVRKSCRALHLGPTLLPTLPLLEFTPEKKLWFDLDGIKPK